ncbi:MAG: tyrosine-type recombinase/integrase [Anaerolineae bacterium]|nr:tyrosine-type recombinase/integrase [Anaerolineae bacterium]
MEEKALTFNEGLALFLKTVAGGQSAHTAQTYGQALAYLLRYLEESYEWTDTTLIADLRPNMLQEFPTWLLQQHYQPNSYTAPIPLAESTRSLYLTATARFLRFLVLRKSLPTFDFVEYTRLKDELHQATNVKPKPVDQKIPPVEIVAALIDAAKQPPQLDGYLAPADRQRQHLAWQRDLAIILALKSSGMRVSELTGLKRANLDYGRQGAWVEGKGRKTRFVAFDDEAWAAIQAYLKERNDEALPAQVERYPLFCRHDRRAKAEARLPLSVRAIQRLIEALSEQADLSGRFNLSPHSLRHYFANGLLELTGNIALVQEALGHQDPKTTRGYTRVKVEQIIDGVRALGKQERQERGD